MERDRNVEEVKGGEGKEKKGRENMEIQRHRETRMGKIWGNEETEVDVL